VKVIIIHSTDGQQLQKKKERENFHCPVLLYRGGVV
jgi:hypothetical protein